MDVIEDFVVYLRIALDYIGIDADDLVRFCFPLSVKNILLLF